MADWEVGYALSELGSGRFFKDPSERYNLVLCGQSLDPITTLGGVHMQPDVMIADIRPGPETLLILPGADTWLSSSQAPVLEMVSQLLKTDIVIAAICGATMGLAQSGMLNNRRHTSNDLAVFQMFCPQYSGHEYYVKEPAVTDGNLITASGLAPVEFAVHIFRRLQVMREETLMAWHLLQTTRKSEYFYSLMNSLKQ